MFQYSSKSPSAGLRLAASLALTCLTILGGGCASHGHPAAKHAAVQKPACYPCGPCGGYFPTCWKMWPDACPNCPIYGGEGAVNEPPLEESVPLPPTGEEIIRPYDEFKPKPIPPSPGPDALPDADLPGTPRKEDVPEDRPEPGDFGEQWQFPPLPGDQHHALAAEDGESSRSTNRQTSRRDSLVRRKAGP